MAVIMEAFPKMSRSLLVKTGYCSAVYEFGYHYQGELRKLKTTTADTSTSKAAVLKLEDEACIWHPETHDLVTKYSCTINVPLFLFGEKGLAAKNGGILGLALMWMNPDAGQRGVYPLAEISSQTLAPAIIKKEVSFPAAQLRGILSLQSVLYLKKRGEPQGAEKFQAVTTGTILGVLDETRIIIDGNGSLFPICETYSPNEPLWWVQCDWEDAREDRFTYDSFCLCLNTAHKDYASLNVSAGLKNSPLLMEIVCSALQTLIMKVLNDESVKADVLHGWNLQAGSVGAMVNYLLHVFDINYDPQSPEALAMVVRKGLEKKI